MKKTFQCKSYRILQELPDKKIRHKCLHVVNKFLEVLNAVEKVEMPYYKNILLFVKKGIEEQLNDVKVPDPYFRRLLLSTLATDFKE